MKKISFYEFFKEIDENSDGFITINEFCKHIDKYHPLSQPIKEGFFAFMDN